MLARRHPCCFFEETGLKKFIAACKKIESDPNYQPHITDDELLNLAKDNFEKSRCIPPVTAMVIQPSHITANTPQGDSLGLVYQVKNTYREVFFKGSFIQSNWLIEDFFVILVNRKDGQCSIHTKEDAEKGIFNLVDENSSINDYLDREYLLYPKEQKTKIYNNL